MGDLVEINIELLSQLGQRLLALDGGQSHLRPIETDERRRHLTIFMMRGTYPSCGTDAPDEGGRPSHQSRAAAEGRYNQVDDPGGYSGESLANVSHIAVM
ncbi:hypothetical protein GGE65_004603 [Skermanella aerolata]|uniref:hypothetical protein n=1 Tax=Skermanella aerolata TaxID=393310 RepID=UPI003D1E8469